MRKVYEFYENTFDSKGFYNCLAQKIKDNPAQYNERLSRDLIVQNDSYKFQDSNIIVKKGDTRFDMPISMGNSTAKERILVLGLEPRHTDDYFNIMRVGNNVFATPFGIDRWYAASGKKIIYGTAFADFFNGNRFFLFSDFVKEYKVSDPNNKIGNSKDARNDFKSLFENKYKDILENEISIFKPTLIIGLGKTDISKKVNRSFLDKYKIHVISHPTNGHFHKSKQALSNLLPINK